MLVLAVSTHSFKLTVNRLANWKSSRNQRLEAKRPGFPILNWEHGLRTSTISLGLFYHPHYGMEVLTMLGAVVQALHVSQLIRSHGNITK